MLTAHLHKIFVVWQMLNKPIYIYKNKSHKLKKIVNNVIDDTITEHHAN